MAFRFIHTADIHLDSPLKSLALRNEELAAIVGNSTRQVLERIVDLCLSESVNALLIAGDLYDGSQTSMKTARFLSAQFRRLNDANIAVYIIRGNHDAESKITRELSLPECVHVFSSKAEAKEFVILNKGPNNEPNNWPNTKPVFIHGISFKDAKAPNNLLPLYQQPIPEAINIGMMHTSLDGSQGHDNYAPCSTKELENHGFDYWALGHIHKRATHVNDQCHIVMPGIPQGRDIGEAGIKSITLVSIDDNNQVKTEEHALALVQFEYTPIELNDSLTWNEVVDLINQAIDQVAAKCEAEQLVVRIVLTGTTPLAWKLHRDEDLLLAEIESRAEGESKWIDKLVINCDAPERMQNAADDGPQTEFSELMKAEISSSEQFLLSAKQAVNEVVSALPAELRDHFGTDELSRERLIKALATKGSKQVEAHINADPTTIESE